MPERDFAMIQLQLNPEIEAQLAAEAEAGGLAIGHYIETIVSARPIEPVRQRTIADAIDRIRELRKGNTLGGLNLKELIHEGHPAQVRMGSELVAAMQASPFKKTCLESSSERMPVRNAIF